MLKLKQILSSKKRSVSVLVVAVAMVGISIFTFTNAGSYFEENFFLLNGPAYLGGNLLPGGTGFTVESGNVGINLGPGGIPAYTLDVNGDGHFKTDFIVDGNVGIGTNAPSEKFDVNGNIEFGLESETATNRPKLIVGDTCAGGIALAKRYLPATCPTRPVNECPSCTVPAQWTDPNDLAPTCKYAIDPGCTTLDQTCTASLDYVVCIGG